jgi:subtilisin family serine protease
VTRRALSIVLACTVITAIGLSTGTAQAGKASKFQAVSGGIRQLNTVHGFKSDSGKIAKSDRSLFHLSGTKLTPVVVKLDYDAIGSYRGYLRGLPATSPGVTNKSLKQNKAAVDKYAKYIAKVEDKARNAVSKLIPRAKVTQSLRLAYGGFSALVPANQISKLLKVPGVAAVQRDKLNKLQAVEEPWQFINADDVWPSLGGLPNAGSNVTVADLDTGIWPENPMLADNGTIPAPTGGPYACEFGDGVNPLYGPGFTCNDKLVGAHVDLNTYLAVIGAEPDEFCIAATGPCSARDSEGHGTHTATTAAGAYVDHAPIFGIDRGPTSGIAPGAHVIAYRVCLEQGCFSSDSAVAVGQAIADGANVLNFSISGGRNPFTDVVELAFLDFYAAGGLANASAGNAGPGAATADHAGPWENTVGASYPSRLYLTTLHLASSDASTLDLTGSSITQPISSPTPVVLSTSVGGYSGGASCNTPFAAGSVSGRIVACARGNPAGRAASSFNVLQGGGAGMIIYNTVHQDLFTDNFWVPTVMLDAGTTPQIPHDTDPFLTFMGAHPGVTATFPTGTATATSAGDIMTTFSSRGPLGDWIKPDITAPGIEILAGNTPEPAAASVASGPPGENFQAIAGTSMSAPHATGVAALVFAAHPTWTPGQVKSAMMTSSVQDVLKPDGVTPADPFNDGAGSIRANRAVKPTVTFDESAADYAALSSDPLGRIDANLPSVNATTMPGTITTTRTMKNVTGVAQPFLVSSTATGGHITVSPSSFSLTAGGSKTITITIHGESLSPGQYFGTITLNATNPASTDVFIPVAWVKTQGVVTLTSSCTPTSFPKGAVTHCTTVAQNLSPAASTTDVSEHFAATSKLSHQNFAEAQTGTGTGGFTGTGADGYDWSGTLSGSVAPTIDSLTPDTGPAGGYLPLSLFGIPPIGGTGDETIANFNVPAFSFGHETYTRLGVVSDGYVVVGGGASADIEFEPQTMPDPARPNNVIAPYWTDLNPAFGGAMRIGTLTDGSDTWIVVDWEGVSDFSSPSTHESFQIWIGINSDAHPSEDVTYVYGPTATAPDPANGGAENRDGSSGKNNPVAGNLNGTGFRVNTSPPLPGGSVTITYDVKGKNPGSYTLTTRMTSNLVGGTTVTRQLLTVT